MFWTTEQMNILTIAESSNMTLWRQHLPMCTLVVSGGREEPVRQLDACLHLVKSVMLLAGGD